MPKPSATVLVLKDAAGGPPAVLLVRRHPDAPFMGGAYVFPGGSIDAGDRDVADATWCDGLDVASALPALDPAEAIAHHVAAIRELFEEAGVLLARDATGSLVSTAYEDPASIAADREALAQGRLSLREIADRRRLRIAADALVLFAHWVTPPTGGRRFDTRFFVAHMPPGQVAAHDNVENTESVWKTAADAIASAVAGMIVLPPPTWTTLRYLERFSSVDEVLTWCRTTPIVRREPKLVEHEGTRVLLMPGDPMNPEEAGDFVPRETRFAWRDGQWRADPEGGSRP